MSLGTHADPPLFPLSAWIYSLPQLPSIFPELTRTVTPTLSRVTLDVITSTVLGVTLATLEAAVPFHQIYQTVFDPSPWGQALTAIDSVVPIRWFSVGENARFNSAIAQLHWIIREIIRQRVADVAAEKAGDHDGRRDLLTRMVQESNRMGLNWTEDDMLGHVCIPR